MSSPSSPPTRPVPPPPDAGSAPPLAPELHSVDDEVDASTLRFLSASLRDPYLPWLLRISLFTLAAKLVRLVAPPLLRLVARLAALAWSALGAVIRFAAWGGMWVGVVTLCAWVLLGAGGALVYGALSARPHYRAWARARPTQARVTCKALVYGGAWLAARRLLGAWAGKAVVVVYAGWEAWTFFARRAAPRAAVPLAVPASAAPSSPAGPPSAGEFDTGAEEPPAVAEGDVDDAELERWARQAKEELLRDSLLRQGRKAGGASARGDSAEEAVDRQANEAPGAAAEEDAVSRRPGGADEDAAYL